jgi:hypothetical protein
LTKGSRRASPTTLRRHDELTLPKCSVMRRTWLPWTAAAADAAQHNAPWNPPSTGATNILLLRFNTTRTLPGPLLLFNTTRTTSGPPSTRASTCIAMDEGVADTTCYDTGPAVAVQHNARHAPDPCCCCCETQTRTLCCCCKGEWSTIFHVLHNWFYKGHGVAENFELDV